MSARSITLPVPNATASETAAFCRAVVDSTDAGVCVTDSDLRFVTLNEAACRSYGRPRSALIGQPFTIVIDPSQRHKAEAAHRAFLEGKGEMGGEWRIRRPDGSQAIVLAAASRLIVAGGRRLRVSTIIDVTAMRRAERALADAAEARARFVGAMNHEFRMPLCAIIGLSDQLLEEAGQGDLPPRQEGRVREIRAAGQHLMEVVQELLDHARLADGLYTPSCRWTGLQGLVDSAVRLARFALKETGVPLLLEGGPDMPLHVDPPALRQALLSLMRVAAQRLSAGGALTLRWRIEGAVVVLEVIGTAPPVVVPLRRQPGPKGVAAEFGIDIAAGILRAHEAELDLRDTGGVGGMQMTIRLPLPPGLPG